MNWHGHEKTVDIDDLVGRIDSHVDGGAVAVALTDLDHFGELNETRGRQAGDRVLEVWIETLTRSLPPDSIIGRLGGDEFGIAIPNATAENAVILLEEVRAHLADHPVDGWIINATFGIASRPPHASETAELFRCANVALARGKREGGAPGRHLRRGEDGAQEQLLHEGCSRPALQGRRTAQPDRGVTAAAKPSTTCSRSCADPRRTLSPTIRLRDVGRTSRASPGTPRLRPSAS